MTHENQLIILSSDYLRISELKLRDPGSTRYLHTGNHYIHLFLLYIISKRHIRHL